MNLTKDGLKKIEETAERSGDVTLLFLVEIYRMMKLLLEKQNNSGDGSTRKQAFLGEEQPVSQSEVTYLKNHVEGEIISAFGGRKPLKQ